jgi:transmembrane sensor
MNGTTTRKDNARQRQLNEEAASWLLKLTTEDSAECRSQFRQWLAASADHVLVFLETTAAYRALDALPASEVDLDALMQEAAAGRGSNVISLSIPERLSAGAQAAAQVTRRYWARSRIAIAAASLVVIAASSYLALSSSIIPRTYTTEVGEQRSIKLPDGSMMILNTRSRVKVHFSDRERQIRLVDGEALFSVAHDGTRPFWVLTDSAAVRAIGTQFNVYRRDGATTVSVTEGVVQVSAEGLNSGNVLTRNVPGGGSALPVPTAGNAIPLAAGEQAHVKSDGYIQTQRDVPVAKVLAWRERRFDFNHATLEEVAREFNRYNELQIRIEDAAVKARVLNGVFNADDPDALLKFLAREPGLSIEVVGNDAVVQRRQPE